MKLTVNVTQEHIDKAKATRAARNYALHDKEHTMNTYGIADNIRKEIATAMVKESEPGYDTEYFGQHFAVDTDGDNVLDAVMHRESQAQWNPWHDNATAFPVSDLYADSGSTFDPTPDTDLQPDDLNDDEYAEIVFAETVDFAVSELPKTFEPIE